MNKFMAIKLKHRKDIENYRISWRNPWFSQVFSCGRSPFLEKRDVILPHKIPLLFSFSKFVFVFVFWWTNLPQGRKIISLMKFWGISINWLYFSTGRMLPGPINWAQPLIVPSENRLLGLFSWEIIEIPLDFCKFLWIFVRKIRNRWKSSWFSPPK